MKRIKKVLSEEEMEKNLDQWMKEPGEIVFEEKPVVKHCGNCNFSDATGKINTENNDPALTCSNGKARALFGPTAGENFHAEHCNEFKQLDAPED